MFHGYRHDSILHKKQDTYIDIAKDIETRFYTSNYELDHYLKEKIKK